MTLHSRFFRAVSGLCCALIALPLQNGYVVSASSNPATTLASSLRALQDGERTAPRDHWDPAYVEAQLGNDPARTFAWVRDHTYWIPYHGILRGPVGVLMDRQGDSLDRALLLATMLKDEGQTVRLAHRTIAAGQAPALAGAALSARLQRLGIASNPGTPGSPTSILAANYQLDAAAIDRTLQTERRAAIQTGATLESRLADQAKRLSAAIGLPADAGGKRNLDAALAAFQDHWWVQTQQGTAWRDWDFVKTTPAAAPDRTVDPANPPADLYHQITLRVVAEKWLAGTTSEKVILEHAWHPSATIGQPISLAFAARGWPKTFPDAGRTVDQSLRAFAAGQREWTPVLSIGADRVQQSAVTAGGDLTMSTSGNDALAVAKNATRGLGAAIDDVFGSSPKAAATTQPSQLSAVWIEYQIDSPGAAAQRIRRDVFDLLGPAARAAKPATGFKMDDAATLTRGLAMLMNTDILPVVSELSPQYVNHLAAQNLLANQSLLGDALANRLGDDFATAQSVAGKIVSGPGNLYRLALSRFALNQMTGWVFVDRPDIFTRHQGFRLSGQKLSASDATDIVSAAVGVDPFLPSPFSIRLAQGVFDTNAEAIVTSDRPSPGSIAWAYDAAHDWVALTSPADPALTTLALPSDVKQRIGNALAAGRIVVAPKAPVLAGNGTFVGWWQIDKETGETLGMGESGWGQSVAEFVVLLAVAASEGFLVSWLACNLMGGSNCTRAGLLGAAFGMASVGLGIGIGAAFGGAISTAGEAGGGLAGGLAGEEGALGSAAGGEAGAAGGEAGGAAGEGGAAGSGGGGGGGAGGGAGGPAPTGPTPAQTDAAWQRFFDRGYTKGQWPEMDAWDKDPFPQGRDFPKTGGPRLIQVGPDQWEVGFPPRSGVPGNGSVPGAGGGSPDSPLATTVVPPANVASPSPLATTLPPAPPARGTLPILPACPAPCASGGATILVGLGGAMNALGGS